MTIADALNDMLNAKEKIRLAIIAKGVDVPKNLSFKDYAEKILEIGNVVTKIEVKNQSNEENSTEEKPNEKIESSNKKKRRQK